jgi:hypothetical protein
MKRSSKLVALTFGASALVTIDGCATGTDLQEESTPAPEEVGTSEEALGAPSRCVGQEGRYSYFLVGCSNGVGTYGLYYCSGTRWRAQDLYYKGGCGQ